MRVYFTTFYNSWRMGYHRLWKLWGGGGSVGGIVWFAIQIKCKWHFFVRDAGGGTRVLHSNGTSPFVHDMTAFKVASEFVFFSPKKQDTRFSIVVARYLNGSPFTTSSRRTKCHWQRGSFVYGESRCKQKRLGRFCMIEWLTIWIRDP